jgi:hypothetical protein
MLLSREILFFRLQRDDPHTEFPDFLEGIGGGWSVIRHPWLDRQ